ncbi:MAG TPA: ice-binding family protein, partial [Candidatus Nitrosotalea sp.]|nr:ice-binding family protein [Candidatus Nitrosotalea sp.]
MSVLVLSTLGLAQNNAFAPSTVDMGTASDYAILSGSVITLGVHNQPVTGNTGHLSTLSDNFTYSGLPLGTDHNATTVGTTGTLGTPLGDAHAALVSIGTVVSNGTHAISASGLACTFSFADGVITLANDTTHGAAGVYSPGVYCINGAADIGTSGITLTGSGDYIFKINGALTSVSGSQVTLSGGADAHNVFWAPTSASLGANTSFQGTILTGPGAITLGANSDLNQGRLVSESAITIEGGVHVITVPGGITLSSIAVTTPATKLSYTVGDLLDTTGLVVTGTFSDASTSAVTPTSITGFDSSVPVIGQVLTIHVGSHTTTYTVDVVAAQATLSSIAVTTPATKLSYTVGDLLDTTGLVVTGTYSNSTTSVVTPTSITGFNSTVSVVGQVITIHVGTVTTNYTINVVAAPGTISLGTANSYVILSGSVITLNVPNQPVTGDTGHVSTLSSTFSYVGTPLGTDHTGVSVGDNITPGTPLGDAHAALVSIGTVGNNGTYAISASGLACTFSFADGAINLSNDTTHPTGIYSPGVYCIDGATDIGTSGITLTGNGPHIFKINGALTSTTGSQVTLSGGALASDVYWTPTSASLGANTSFQGTILTGPGAITLGAVGDLNQGRLISESAITIESAGPHIITVPGGIAPATLSSIAVTTPATKLTYTVGESLNTTGLVVTGTYSNSTTSVVTPTSITGFDSSVPVSNQVITIHVGTHTTTYTINVVAPVITINLGTSGTFGILASTFTNTAAGVNITGDVGYTTAPAMLPTIIGSLFVAPNSTYSQAGVDQGTALNALNALTCNFSFGAATDLSLLPQPLTPGVYCIAGAQSVGTGGITLNGAGTYVFRSTGALNTVANSHVTLTGGADALKVFWTPVVSTLGTNSVFVGTDIDNSGITIGGNVTWLGRALDFATTVSTGPTVSITVPTVIPDTTNPTISI